MNYNRGQQQQQNQFQQQNMAANLGAHETMEIHEILVDAIDAINTFELYRPHVRDQRLRQILDTQVSHIAQDYNNLVNHLQRRGMSQAVPYRTTASAGNRIKYGLKNPAPDYPVTNIDQLNDQDVASCILGLSKGSAVLATTAALECADPTLRNLVANCVQSKINMAYETFQYMNERGWYQVPTMQDNTTRTIIDTYQPVDMFQGNQMF